MNAGKLSGKQRRFLKGLAHGSRVPLCQVGREGLSESVLKSIGDALTTNELIKVQFLEKDGIDRHEYAATVAERCGATLVQVIGFKAVLYRPDPEKPRITLPR